MFGAHAFLARLRSHPASGGHELEQRVRRLEAEHAVRDLVHAYEYAFDAKDVDLESKYGELYPERPTRPSRGG